MEEKTVLNYIGTLYSGEPAVLFIPGAMTTPYVFAGLANYLPCQSAMIDWNNSSGPWTVEAVGKKVLDLIDQLRLGPVVLAGYSWGGVVSIAAAIQDAGKRIAGLMIADTGANAAGHGDPTFPDKLEKSWPDRELFRAFSRRCFARPITRGFYQQLEAYAMALQKDTVCQAAHSVRESDFRDRLDRITCPVQILHGLRDQSRTMQHAQLLAEKIRDSELFWLDCGHTPMVEVHEEYLQKLLYFIHKIRLVEDLQAWDVLGAGEL